MKKGFTIIELLAVIAIIGILSAIVLSSLSTIRAKSRDSKRQADMAQMKLAMELFYDANSRYPNCGSPSPITCCSTGPCGPSGTWSAMEVISQGFLPSMPTDPINSTGSSGYGYFYYRGFKKIGDYLFCRTDVDTDYVLATRLESGSGQVRSCGTNCSATTCTGATWNNSSLNVLIGN
jgi:prepilin-type N-terminal cleavage/methylation domain-containing protein